MRRAAAVSAVRCAVMLLRVGSVADGPTATAIAQPVATPTAAASGDSRRQQWTEGGCLTRNGCGNRSAGRGRDTVSARTEVGRE